MGVLDEYKLEMEEPPSTRHTLRSLGADYLARIRATVRRPIRKRSNVLNRKTK
jgi:hypothetical protein